jgi:hypothetical protein
LQLAIGTLVGTAQTLLLPPGTLLVSDSLNWTTVAPGSKHDGAFNARITVMGAGRNKTVIRLRNDSPGFGSVSTPKAILITASEHTLNGDNAFGNSLSDLTVDVGTNPGAVAISYLVNNQGSIERIALRGRGHVGLALVRPTLGPGMISDMWIAGFDIGILSSGTCCSMVFEHIRLSNQTLAGVHNTDNVLTFRDLTSGQREGVPALISESSFKAGPLITVLDSVLNSQSSTNDTTSPHQCAIVNRLKVSTAAVAQTLGNLLLRNVSIHGYNCSVQNGTVMLDILPWEYTSRPPIAGSRTLGLVVRETPPPAQPSSIDSIADWWTELSSLGNFGNDTSDSLPAFRAAMANGKPGVSLSGHSPAQPSPREFGREYYLSGTVTVQAPVERLVGWHSRVIYCGPTFDDGRQPVAVLDFAPSASSDSVAPVTLERWKFFQFDGQCSRTGWHKPGKHPVPPVGAVVVRHRDTKRPLVLRHVMLGGMTQVGQDYQHASLVATDPGITDIFLHDVDGGMFVFGGGVRVWARQFDPETKTPLIFPDSYRAKVTLSNATLWCLGLKIEQPGVVIAANDSQLELFGGFLDPLHNSSTAVELRRSVASLSFVVLPGWHDPSLDLYSTLVNSDGQITPTNVATERWISSKGGHGSNTALWASSRVTPLVRSDDESPSAQGKMFMGFYAHWWNSWSKGGSRLSELVSVNASSWMNLLISHNATFLQEARAMNLAFVGLMDAKKLLFEHDAAACAKTPHPSCNFMRAVAPSQARQQVQLFKKLLSKNHIHGLFLGDEVNAPFVDINATVALLRAELGDVGEKGAPLLYINQGWVFAGPDLSSPCTIHKNATTITANRAAYPVVSGGDWTAVPLGLDLIGFDFYPKVPNAADEEVLIVRDYAKRCVYPLLAQHQRFIAVPGVFGNPAQPVEPQDLWVEKKLQAYEDWLHDGDKKFAGLNPWHFDRRQLKGGLGARDLPRSLAAVQRIGRELIAISARKESLPR